MIGYILAQQAEDAPGFFDFTWWQWVLILVLIVLIVLYFVMRRRGT